MTMLQCSTSSHIIKLYVDAAVIQYHSSLPLDLTTYYLHNPQLSTHYVATYKLRGSM